MTENISTAFLEYIAIAFALVFVIEGLVYSLFPHGMKQIMSQAIMAPDRDLRRFGLFMVALGFLIVFLVS